MPRGDNPNSRKNLESENSKKNRFKKGEKKAKETVQKMKKSKQEKKTLRQCLEIIMQKEFGDENGYKKTGAEVLAWALFKNATKSPRGFEVFRDTVGEKPVDEIRDVTNTEICIDFGDLDND